jgi:hypothetical protein
VHDRWIPISTSVYLEGTTIKAIIELIFNPEEGVAHLSSAYKGLSIMACWAHTSAEMERIREREEALSATETTRQLDELLHLSKGSTRAPADNFWELKMNIATFMSLVWVLFGSECDYYKGLRNVYATLKLKEVMAQKQSFPAEHCRRITWAILDDGRAHFDDVKITLDFRGSDEPVWPQSYLIDILRNVRYALPVERANFPEEWKHKIRASGPEQGGQMGGNLTSPPKGQDRMLLNGSSTNASLQRKHGQHQGYGAGGGHSVIQGNTGQWWPNHFSRTIPGGGVPRGGFPSRRHATATRLAIRMEGRAPPKDQGGDARIPGPNERTGSPCQNSGSGGAPSDRASYSAKVHPRIGAPLLVLDKCPRPVHLPGLPFLQGRWASATGGHNGRFF